MSIEQSKENFKKELNIIKHIAVNNRYAIETIDNIFQNHPCKQVIKNLSKGLPPKDIYFIF